MWIQDTVSMIPWQNVWDRCAKPTDTTPTAMHCILVVAEGLQHMGCSILESPSNHNDNLGEMRATAWIFYKQPLMSAICALLLTSHAWFTATPDGSTLWHSCQERQPLSIPSRADSSAATLSLGGVCWHNSTRSTNSSLSSSFGQVYNARVWMCGGNHRQDLGRLVAWPHFVTSANHNLSDAGLIMIKSILKSGWQILLTKCPGKFASSRCHGRHHLWPCLPEPAESNFFTNTNHGIFLGWWWYSGHK